MDDSSHPSDKQLRSWYKNTAYRVYKPALELRIGRPNPRLDHLLDEKKAGRYAYITAWNPYSRLAGRKENESAQKRLEAELRRNGYEPMAGAGEGLDNNWPPEPSFLVPGIPLREAVLLGRRYRQKAILYGLRGGRPHLLFL